MINWEKGELAENLGHDKMYCASGEDEQGRLYEGTRYECDGQFIEILNIEKL
jgi:hypothetical protein